MILSEALTILKFRLGSRTDTDLDTIIPVEMAQAQFELEHTGAPPWFLLTEDATASTTPGERRLLVPTDFLLESEDGCLWRVEDTGELTELDKGNFDDSIAYWGMEQGVPSGYATLGAYFQLFPIPDAAYTMRMKYYAADTLPTAMAAGDTNLWLTWGQDLLLAYTGRRLATYLRDVELAEIFAKEAVAADTRLVREATARDETNRNRSKGD